MLTHWFWVHYGLLSGTPKKAQTWEQQICFCQIRSLQEARESSCQLNCKTEGEHCQLQIKASYIFGMESVVCSGEGQRTKTYWKRYHSRYDRQRRTGQTCTFLCHSFLCTLCHNTGISFSPSRELEAKQCLSTNVLLMKMSGSRHYLSMAPELGDHCAGSHLCSTLYLLQMLFKHHDQLQTPEKRNTRSATRLLPKAPSASTVLVQRSISQTWWDQANEQSPIENHGWTNVVWCTKVLVDDSRTASYAIPIFINSFWRASTFLKPCLTRTKKMRNPTILIR